MLLVKLASMNVSYSNNIFHSIIPWKILFFIQIYCYPEVFLQPPFIAFFETSVLKEVRIYVRFLQNNITMLLIPKVHTKDSSS